MGRNPLILLVLSAATGLHAQTPRLTAPQVDSAEGAALVALARSAMHVYLRERTAAEGQSLPGELTRLERRPYTASVRLRRGGQVIAQTVQTGNSLPRNVIQAALTAMRQPGLGDVVTQGVLEALVVEVEVLGPPVLVGQETRDADHPGQAQRLQADLERLVQPGLVGLRAQRGTRSTWALPSTAYVEGLDAGDLRRRCLRELGLTREDIDQPIQWSAFLTLHFVSYPEGRVVELQRGKLPVPFQAVDRALLGRSADRAGRRLLIDLMDRWRDPKQPSPLLDNLHACWALAHLAHARRDPKLQAALDKPLALAASTVRQTDRAAYVQSPSARDQLAATALLALALEHRTAQSERDLRQRLLAAIRLATDANAQVTPSIDGSASGPADPEAICLARLALFSAGSAQRPSRLPAWPREGIELTPAQTLWALQARLPLKLAGKAAGVVTGPNDQPATRGRADESALTIERFDEVLAACGLGYADRAAPDDERGGLGRPGQPPTIELTALACGVLRQISAEAVLADRRTARSDALRLDAQRFCARMVYAPLEAFFAEHDDLWEGAVRAGPQAAATSLPAAAAAIRALAE